MWMTLGSTTNFKVMRRAPLQAFGKTALSRGIESIEMHRNAARFIDYTATTIQNQSSISYKLKVLAAGKNSLLLNCNLVS